MDKQNNYIGTLSNIQIDIYYSTDVHLTNNFPSNPFV